MTNWLLTQFDASIIIKEMHCIKGVCRKRIMSGWYIRLGMDSARSQSHLPPSSISSFFLSCASGTVSLVYDDLHTFLPSVQAPSPLPHSSVHPSLSKYLSLRVMKRRLLSFVIHSANANITQRDAIIMSYSINLPTLHSYIWALLDLFTHKNRPAAVDWCRWVT